MKTILTAMFCVLASSCAFSSSDNSHSEQKDSWFDFRSQFSNAFEEGNVSELERLKSDWSHKGFANINDLGGKFLKYGSGMGKWSELIADAQKNKK